MGLSGVGVGLIIYKERYQLVWVRGQYSNTFHIEKVSFLTRGGGGGGEVARLRCDV